jgi:hypothetical protein
MHIIIIDCVVQSYAAREADISMRFRVRTPGRKVCLQVPLQRVDGAVGADDGRRFSWLG